MEWAYSPSFAGCCRGCGPYHRLIFEATIEQNIDEQFAQCHALGVAVIIVVSEAVGVLASPLTMLELAYQRVDAFADVENAGRTTVDRSRNRQPVVDCRKLVSHIQ